MSILKLKPSCKDYLWGGSRLVEEYGRAVCDTEWEIYGQNAVRIY